MSFYTSLRRRWTALDRVAIVTSTETLTFGELDQRARRAAGLLRAAGVERGDVVALQLPRGLPFLELHLGAMAMGAVTLPLNDKYTPRELSYLLKDSEAVLAWLVQPDAVQAPGCALRRAEDARRDLDDATPVAADSTDGDEVAVLLYTSGTTGQPKGARISHANIEACVSALHQAWRWSESDVLVHALPLFHVHGLFVAQHGALYAGAKTVWMDRFDPHAAFDTLRDHGGTVFMGVPTFYNRLVDLPRSRRADVDGVRLFTSGSAPLPASIHDTFREHFGHAIVERYGMTEVGIVLSNPLDGPRPGTVGHPLPGVQARIVDESGEDVAEGVVGQLLIRGPSVFRGYLGRPEQTAAALREGWMWTGDLASRADGYIAIAGRNSDMVISGGLNVYPREVESVLLEDPAVAHVAVFGVPHDDLGEQVVAAVVPAAGTTPDPSALIATARRQLAPYKCPRAIQRMDALPRNAMGKVLKAVLRRDWGKPSVRRATVDEAERIAAWNIAMAAETEDMRLDPATVARGVRRVFDDPALGAYYVAEILGEPAGQLMVTFEWSDWRARWVWWIQSVYVAPPFRRRGVYRALHTATVDAARAADAGGVRLYVDQRNHGAATTYERVGMNGDHYRMFEQMFDEPPAS